jgi:hypothetical protein
MKRIAIPSLSDPWTTIIIGVLTAATLAWAALLLWATLALTS